MVCELGIDIAMTNTTKPLSREEIEAVREMLMNIVVLSSGDDSDPFDDAYSLLAHIEAQEALIGELAGILQDFYNAHPNSQHVYAAEKLLDKVEAMKEIGNDQTEEAR